ncbi:Uncharacterized protein HZ326_27617 [Fusarium oxysporum f. sp. albedinis]|nr:Uncharacterized protein HZ326_27617 [Fusarium oxysporum f. sp. albedinis]
MYTAVASTLQYSLLRPLTRSQVLTGGIHEMTLIANCRLPDLFSLSVTQSEARDMVKPSSTDSLADSLGSIMAIYLLSTFTPHYLKVSISA